MRRLTALFIPLLFVIVLVGCSDEQTTAPTNATQAEFTQGGFDMYGYNYTARLFNGILDGADRNLDGLYWGANPEYANDRLVMKWTADWDRGKAEGWSNPPYDDAWTTNHYNGQVPNGSGEVWHYKFIWVGPLLQNSPYWVPGGQPIWGQFETIFSHGTVDNEHFWDLHATPNGLGFH